MATIAFRLAYQLPMPDTDRIDLRSYGPAPLFVGRRDYLTSSDFVGAKLLLIRSDDGRLGSALTLVNNPIPGHEIWLSHLTKDEALSLVNAFGD